MSPKDAPNMTPKDDRLRIADLGEWYEDLLKIDAAINGRSGSQQGSSLLCAKLQEREERIKQRVRYLASKREISFEAMWLILVKGEYRKLTDSELKELNELIPFD